MMWKEICDCQKIKQIEIFTNMAFLEMNRRGGHRKESEGSFFMGECGDSILGVVTTFLWDSGSS